MSEKSYTDLQQYVDRGLKNRRHYWKDHFEGNGDDPWWGSYLHEPDDSGPQFLLKQFEAMVGETYERSYPPRGRDYPDLDAVSGEIEWRAMHSDDSWKENV